MSATWRQIVATNLRRVFGLRCFLAWCPCRLEWQTGDLICTDCGEVRANFNKELSS